MDIVRESLAITLVFALLWAALWLSQGGVQFGRGSVWARTQHEPQRMESRGKLALTAQHSLHLVRAGDREFVSGCASGGITCCLGSFLGHGTLSKTT